MMSMLSEVFNDCMDFQKRSFCEDHLQVAYLSTLIGNDELVRELLHPLSKLEERDIIDLLTQSPFLYSMTRLGWYYRKFIIRSGCCWQAASWYIESWVRRIADIQINHLWDIISLS
ncbi:hypothetical protein GYMC10_2988 [Paenibacillus sp. Y412MC10]|nr:hypothetical protein GYMC10_2988 [Paenibacillus sp. Y412MC10]